MQEQDYKFVDFRIVKLKDFLNKHRNCKTETVLGVGKCGDGFRFIKCDKCKVAYFAGKV